MEYQRKPCDWCTKRTNNEAMAMDGALFRFCSPECKRKMKKCIEEVRENS